jgi:hypothetical protein
MNEKFTLTRRDAIEWICYTLGIRRPHYVASTRRMLEAATIERIEKEYNDMMSPLFLNPVYFTVIEGEHHLYPLPTKEETEAARQRNRGPNA